MKDMLRSTLLSLLLCAPAHADNNHEDNRADIEVGDVLICDSQEHAKRYIALYSGDQEAAIQAVNRVESDPQACGIANAAFLRGPEVAAASHGNMAFKVVRILVIGVDGVDGVDGFRDVDPIPYFTIFGVTEYSV